MKKNSGLGLESELLVEHISVLLSEQPCQAQDPVQFPVKRTNINIYFNVNTNVKQGFFNIYIYIYI